MASNRVGAAVALPVGAAAGAMGSLCGVGGGVVVIPALHRFTTLKAKTISAVSMASISLSAGVGAASYMEQGFANVPCALTWMVTTVPSAVAGSLLLRYVHNAALRTGTGLMLLAVAPLIWQKGEAAEEEKLASLGPFGGNVEALKAKRTEDLAALARRNRVDAARIQAWWGNASVESVVEHLANRPGHLACGVVTGLLSGMIGIGGGLIMNMFMTTYSDMQQHEIVATSLLTTVPMSLSSATAHLVAGRLPLRAAGGIAVASVVTMGATSRLLGEIEDAQLKKIFAVVLFCSSIPLVFK